MVGIVLEGIFLIFANRHTTVARSTILANTTPLFIVLLSSCLTHRLPNRRVFSGMLIGFAGIILLVFSRGGGDCFGGSERAVLGDVLALMASLCWTFYTVFGEEVVHQYGGLFSTGVLFFLGTLMMIPVMLAAECSWVVPFSWTNWAGILYIGGMTGGMAYGLWYQSMKYLHSWELSSFGYLSAFLAVALSCLCLHERLVWQFFPAALMIFSGVFLMVRRRAES